MTGYDATVVGAGPNGLAAAAHLTRHGRRVRVLEAASVPGGGARTEELTLPGFRHDVCSAIHPLGVASPFFRSLDLEAHGLTWVHPELPLSHPVAPGRAVALHRDLEATCEGLADDAATYRRLVAGPLLAIDDLLANLLGPVAVPTRSLLSTGRFGAIGALPASRLAARFSTDAGRGLIAGLAAHAISPLDTAFTSAVALFFAVTAHAHGWPLAAGGSSAITDALASIVTAGGGEIVTDHFVASDADVDDAEILLLDLMPPAALSIAGTRTTARAARRLRRWRPGPGVFKVDWALSGPIPWADELSPRAGTVHVGGTYEEIATAEAAVAAGDHPDRPFVLVAQQSRFDPTRAPEGKHTAWAYCHVPSGSSRDMTEAISDQIERFAPGFRDVVLATHTMGPLDFERHNANYVGGDIGGGAFGVRKLLQVGNPYRIGDGVFLCSSATPPGAGVHGMCGFHAAAAALS